MILKKKSFYVSLDSNIMKDHKIIRDILTWTSSNGKDYLYSNIDINHLKNIINKMERGEVSERIDQLFDLKNELDYRNLIKND